MATLTGNPINTSYEGILKTLDNAAIADGVTSITDGAGNATGLSLDITGTTTRGLKLDASFFPNFGLKQTTWDKTTYPMSANSGSAVGIEFKDNNDLTIAQISQDRYGSMYYENMYANEGESHVFRSRLGNGALTAAKISLNSWNNANNSNNWFLGYQQSVDSLTFNSGTGDLTLGRQTASDLVVNIPTGGGAAGLTVGTGTNSLINAVGGASTASGLNSLAIGNACNTNQEAGIAIGDRASATGYGSFAAGLFSQAAGFGGFALGQYAESSQPYGSAFGPSSKSIAESAIAFGQSTEANHTGAIAMGRQVVTVNTDTTHVRALYIVAPNGGTGGNGITMLSPNGTAYTLTVSDAGALVIS